MRRPLIYSLILHLLILILIVIDLPFSFQRAVPEPEIIGVDVVTKLPEKKDVKTPEPDPVEKEPEIITEEDRKAPPPPEASTTGAIEDNVEKVEEKKPEAPKPPEPVKPEPVPDPVPAPKPKIRPKPKPKVEAAPKPAAIRPAVKPKPHQYKSKEDKDFDELSESLLTQDAQKASGKGGGKKGPKGLEDADRERISKQLQPCWVMQEVANVNVEITVKMGGDGRFVDPKMKTGLFSGNAVDRAIAEAAQRAIIDQRCNDFSWLHEKFPDLDTLTLIFNPRDMVGW